MAVPVRLRNLPEYLRSSQFSYDASTADAKGTESQELLQFPQSACVLWDGTSTGSPVFLHVAQNRKPRLLLWEKLLWLIHKQVDSDGSANKVLVGSLSVEKDVDAVSFKIDRLDTRQTDLNASLLQDDVLIPVQISTNNAQERNRGSSEGYAEAIKMLQKRCASPDAMEMNSMLLVKGWCTLHCQQQSDQTIAHLQFDLVTPGNVFKATPVPPVPVIPSALAKNLAGPRNLSHMQGRPKMGYLTMDATRKLLLVLESDPKVASLAVVGIWVSGVSMVHHPFVWASCLRYLQNERLQDRVCTPPEGFLLVIYSSLHSKPEFYEICATSGKSDLQFDLYTGYEVTTLCKKSSGSEPGVLEWELCPVRNGPKREMFDAALESVKSQSRQEAGSDRARPSISTNEDIIPRMTPAPHQSKAMTIRPMVPELSMIWNDSSPSPCLQPFPCGPAPPACLNTAFNAPCSTPLSAAATAPMPNERTAVGFVPSSRNTGPGGGGVLTASGAGSCCPSSQDHQDSECVPRVGLKPAQYNPPQSVYDQNNSARTCGGPAVSSSASTGFLSVAYSNCLPQSVAPLAHHHHYSRQGQAGSEYSSASVPSHSSQGTAVQQCAHNPQQQRYPHDGFRPQSQPHPRPRLIPAAGVHFCRPSLAGPAARPPHSFPHPSVHVQRPAHGGPLPQPMSSQGQHFFHGGVPVSTSHPNAPYPSAQGERPSHTDSQSIPQAFAVSHAQMGPDFPSHPNSVLGGSAPFQGPWHHSAGTVTSSQGQCQPPPRHTGSMGALSWQQENQLANVFPTQTGPGPHSGSIPCAHILGGKAQMSCGPAAGLGQPEGPVSTAPPGTHSSAPSLLHTGNNSHHQLDSTSGSGKSSDDSGLSVTPDRSNPSPKHSHLLSSGSPQTQTQEVGGYGGAPALSLQSVNWAGVPGEVVQLLVQQDAQLKMLQAQIQQLLFTQQQQQQAPSPGSDVSTPTPAPLSSSSSGLSTPSTLKRETCSTAVNTTLLDSGSPWGRPGQGGQCVSVQTSPQKPPPPHPPHFSPHPSRQSPSSSSHSGQDAPAAAQQRPPPVVMESGEGACWARTPSRQEGPSVAETPSDIRHQGPVQLSSTEHEEAPTDRSGSLHSTDSLEQHPSPVRSVESHLQLSNSTPSPLSASMCVRQEEEMEDESRAQEVSPDSKEYYDQLINNIRLFLNSQSQDADTTEWDRMDTVASTEEEATNTGLKMFDSTVGASPSMPACPSGGADSSSNTTLIPHINYLSMMLGCDMDASLEMNAMAMKYLRDEQLTQVARHHQSPATRRAGGSSHLLLRQALVASLDTTGASDISRLGMSATNLSMATKKYLEKHGLLGGEGGGESMLDTNQTIRLQTDFSLAIMSESHGSSSLPTSPQKGSTPQHANAHSPVKREMFKPAFRPSPAIAEDGINLRTENDREQLGDLGASPALRPPRRYNRDCSPEDTPIFPDRYRGPQQQRALISDCSLATEDDRILDIEKLKQLPKLL